MFKQKEEKYNVKRKKKKNIMFKEKEEKYHVQ